MPELPEVETIARQLSPLILGKEAEKLVIIDHKLGAQRAVASCLQRDVITSLQRQGKYLILNFESKAKVVVHLRMSGKLLFQPEASELSHLRWQLLFTDGSRLCFTDPRRFGTLEIYPAGKCTALKIGPDALSQDEVRRKIFSFQCKKKLKALLLDQGFVSGIGNIYADEILFRAKLHPQRAFNTLTAEEKKRLLKSISAVLRQAIDNQGTTLRDYRRPDNQQGKNQHYLKVYGREGQLCLRCKSLIVRQKIAGRSSYFCIRCQH